MSRRSFTVCAKWDDEAGVYYSESDIIGLHIEAQTIEEFEEIIEREAPDLIVANHMSKPELAHKSIRELIPTVFLRSDERPLAVA